MKLQPVTTLDDLASAVGRGIITLVYGRTGVGKTVCSMAYSPDPVLYLAMEKRDYKHPLRVATETKGKMIKFQAAHYTDTISFIQILDDIIFHPEKYLYHGKNGDEPFATIIVDSLTHFVTVDLPEELSAQAEAERRSSKKTTAKELVSMTKMSEESYGAFAAHSVRIVNQLGTLAQEYGMNIVITALTENNPRWGRMYDVAPALAGKAFPKVLPGFCDLIGYIDDRYVRVDNGDGTFSTKLAYPPWIFFESLPDNHFMCKKTGIKLAKCPYNLGKILESFDMDKAAKDKLLRLETGEDG